MHYKVIDPYLSVWMSGFLYSKNFKIVARGFDNTERERQKAPVMTHWFKCYELTLKKHIYPKKRKIRLGSL